MTTCSATTTRTETPVGRTTTLTSLRCFFGALDDQRRIGSVVRWIRPIRVDLEGRVDRLDGLNPRDLLTALYRLLLFFSILGLKAVHYLFIQAPALHENHRSIGISMLNWVFVLLF